MGQKYVVCAITGIKTGKLAAMSRANEPETIALKDEIKNIMEQLIREQGVTAFMSGMSPFIEFMGAELVQELKRSYPFLKLICVEAHRDWEYRVCRSRQLLERYHELISLCDEHIVLQERYSVHCEEEQMDYISDLSDFAIAVWKRPVSYRAGIVYGVLKKGGMVYQLNPDTLEICCRKGNPPVTDDAGISGESHGTVTK